MMGLWWGLPWTLSRHRRAMLPPGLRRPFMDVLDLTWLQGCSTPRLGSAAANPRAQICCNMATCHVQVSIQELGEAEPQQPLPGQDEQQELPLF